MLSCRNLSILLLFTVFTASSGFSADKIRCSTVDVFRRNAINNPDVLFRKQQLETEIQRWIAQDAGRREDGTEAVITIPVVVHVIYNTAAQNISLAQIQSQIDRLNKDFSNTNSDKLLSTHPFFSITGNPNVEFCLAGIDPDGRTTNGITRTSTSVTEFSDNDNIKFTSSGGFDAWDARQYLNIWVGKLGGDLLGYAQFPSDLLTNASTDGVVIGYRNFGTIGVDAPYDLGRTATHEIGHWLNLEHIWGDDNDCTGTDKVSDTPNQETETAGCPTGVKTDACATTAPGIMYENYMDYTDDACMVMFTKGQVTRMNAVFNITRSAIKISNKCSGTTGITLQTQDRLKIYPNPVQNYLTIEGLPKTKSKYFKIDIFNVIGEKVYVSEISSSDTMIEMADFKTGTYVLNIYNDEFSATQKLTVVK